MDISSKQLVNKMGELIEKAKQEPSEEKRKGYIIAIQALCEVITSDTVPSLPISHSVKRIATVPATTSVPMTEPIQIDDANGHSIFDF